MKIWLRFFYLVASLLFLYEIIHTLGIQSEGLFISSDIPLSLFSLTISIGYLLFAIRVLKDNKLTNTSLVIFLAGSVFSFGLFHSIGGDPTSAGFLILWIMMPIVIISCVLLVIGVLRAIISAPNKFLTLTKIAIIFAVAVIILGGISAYFYSVTGGRLQIKTPYNQSPNWSTYTNTQYGISFKYHPAWIVEEKYSSRSPYNLDGFLIHTKDNKSEITIDHTELDCDTLMSRGFKCALANGHIVFTNSEYQAFQEMFSTLVSTISNLKNN